jgi:hypothetical protein
MVALLILCILYDAPGMLRDRRRRKDLVVMLSISLLGVVASVIMAAGYAPDFYGFFKGLLQ